MSKESSKKQRKEFGLKFEDVNDWCDEHKKWWPSFYLECPNCKTERELKELNTCSKCKGEIEIGGSDICLGCAIQELENSRPDCKKCKLVKSDCSFDELCKSCRNSESENYYLHQIESKK